MNKMKKEKKYHFFLIIMPFIAILISNVLYGFYNHQLMLVSFFFNYIPSIIIIYSFFSLLVFITKSLKKANLIIILLFGIFLIINQIKIFYTQEPIYLSDIFFITEIGDIFSITNGTIINFIETNSLFLLIQVIVYGTLFYIIKKIEILKNIKRKFFYFISTLVLIIISLPLEFMNNLAKNIFMYNITSDNSAAINQIQYYLYNGLLGGIYGNMLENRIFKPQDYDEELLNKILNTEVEKVNSKNKPNIIVVFSESFFDITKLGQEIEYSDDILKDYHNIASSGKVIQMLSPSYGGISSNVEFELLTSGNLAYYSRSYIPYLKLMNQRFLKTDNIVKILNNNGYKTNVFTASSDNIFDAKKAYEYIGFQDKNDYDKDKRNYKGYYISDHYVIDKVIELIEKEEDSIFYFLTTMQNHMPYRKEKYEKYDVEIKKHSLSKDDEEVILSYSQGLFDASQELNRLYEYIKMIEEDTIVIFLGDHLPYLSTNHGDNLIDKLDYFNSDDDILNIYRLYNTEALVFANYDILFDNTEYLSPDLLLPYVLKNIGINLPPYYSYLINESKKNLPCYNRYIAISSDGKKYNIDNMTEIMKKEYNIRKSLQYKLYYE